ncbi:hypothetical protein GGS20DRAFT_579791 [Poronia punctata]|nr:hypothetical protein GGS20DRAFT_579791 [Poronia punctata]
MPDNAPTLPQNASSPDAAAFQRQYQQLYAPPSTAFSGQLEMPPQGRQGPYDMSAMATALPQPGYRPGFSVGPQQQQQQQQQRYVPPGTNVISQLVQYPGQPHMSHLAGQQYYVQQHQPLPHYYNAQMSAIPQQHHTGPQMPRGGMGMGYYPNPVLMNQHQSSTQAPTYYYPAAPNHYQAQNPSMHNNPAQSQYFIADGSTINQASGSALHKGGEGGGLRGFGANEESPGNPPGIVRGPPRKPRQTGHAIWIGNLPPQTDLMNLVHHVCKEAPGLESLFLISKSNCAFANFRDEATCITAQQKLHESRFQSVRLVSRLRKSTVEGTAGQTAPIGPASSLPSGQPTPSETSSSPVKPANSPQPTKGESAAQKSSTPTDGGQKDKFFILKSLTVEDLELSIQNGVWATQSHNEEVLNRAFRDADNVYLIFSANKSGEYFGYAKMISPINDDPAAAIEFAPKAQTTNSVDLPKAIPTEATATCPRGRIIDDSARGTIFWEVERDEPDGVLSDTVSEDSESTNLQEGEGGTNGWGKPFKLRWLSTARLPFYRTRGLRNPWNSHREVKIARDGTELETTVGRKLIGLFNRVQSPVSMPVMVLPAGIPTGYPPPMSPSFRQ